MLDKLKDVEIFFNLHSLQHTVQYNEGSSSAHTSAAVDQQRTAVCVGVSSADPFDEINEDNAILRHPMIRPTSEVKLSHFQWSTSRRCGLENNQNQLKILLSSHLPPLTFESIASK